ncbi:MAG: hypothetical protein ACR2JC_10470 [Chloroflexota bacterium]|nr:MAG: hypothetical protein DLM70_06560 [Chloroflexota bacterium]
MRKRLFLVTSVAYVALGLVIVARSAFAHVLPVAVVGIVFVALGVVRLRDYVRYGGTRGDS